MRDLGFRELKIFIYGYIVRLFWTVSFYSCKISIFIIKVKCFRFRY